MGVYYRTQPRQVAGLGAFGNLLDDAAAYGQNLVSSAATDLQNQAKAQAAKTIADAKNVATTAALNTISKGEAAAGQAILQQASKATDTATSYITGGGGSGVAPGQPAADPSMSTTAKASLGFGSLAALAVGFLVLRKFL